MNAIEAFNAVARTAIATELRRLAEEADTLHREFVNRQTGAAATRDPVLRNRYEAMAAVHADYRHLFRARAGEFDPLDSDTSEEG